MRFQSVLELAAIVAVSFSVGCSMTNPTIRSQGPDNNSPIVGSAPGYGEFKRAPYIGNTGNHDFRPFNGFRDNNFGYGNGYYTPFNNQNAPYTVNDGNGCQAQAGCSHCNYGHCCPHGGCGFCGYKDGMPQHYQTYQYDWPKNMVYPQQGAPSGMVQYPYYTLRGPTDFFMEKSL